MTIAPATLGNDDLHWARHVATRLPNAQHQVLGIQEHPTFFAGLPETGLPPLDEPAPFAASAARVRHLAETLTAAGTRLHLNGQGGDEVLTAPVAYLREHLRTARPRQAWRRVRGHAALAGIPARHLLAAMTAAPSYQDWLTRLSTADLTYAPHARIAEMAGWEAPVYLPPWATREAETRLRAQLRTAAGNGVALAANAAGHYEQVRLHAMARRSALYRDALHALTGTALTVHLPFFDRAVIEACLATRPADRTDPWQPKPLLHAALDPILGEVLPSRRTKGHYNHDILHGLLAHRAALTALFDGSALAGLGLIDDAGVRRVLATAETGQVPPSFLNETLAVELWLRQITSPSTPTPLPTALSTSTADRRPV